MTGREDDNKDGTFGGWGAFEPAAPGTQPDDADRLAFDENERLPWLESADDEEEYQGADTGRVMGFALIGIAVLAILIGGIWWVTHRSDQPELVADGSTIKAPATPYKTPPPNPGGKTFEGTGDSSFVVSEGQSRPPKLGATAAQPVAVATPTPAPTASASAKPKPTATPTEEVAEVSGVGVQVGAYMNRATAEAGWTKLSGQYEALSGVRHRVVEGQADIGTVYRLQAVPGDLAAANALCGKLKAAGLACQVKR